MITSFQLYLILMLDGVRVVTTTIAIILAIVTFIFGGLSVDDSITEEGHRHARKRLKYLVPVFILSLSAAVFIPNTEQAATIFLAPKILNNEKIQDIGQNGLDLANNLLKLSNEYIEKSLITKEKTK